MAWVFLIIAGCLEVGWAVGLKYTDGFTRFWPTIGTLVAMAISMGLLGLAVKTLPIGTAYAVWTGIGAAGTALVGILFLGDGASLFRVLGISLIVGGIICLKLVSHP